MNVYLKNTAGTYSFCSADGGSTNQLPVLTRSVKDSLVLNFLDESGDPLTVPTCSSFNFAIARDWADATPPEVLVTEGITQTSTSVTVVVKPNTAELIAALSGKKSETFTAELKGYAVVGGEVTAVLICQFSIIVNNLVYPGSGVPTALEADYYLKSEVDALLQAATVYQFSVDGSTSWHDTYASTDKYYRERVDITGSAWSAALPLGRSEVILDTKTYNFSTIAESANPLVISKTLLGIAADAEPQVSVWLVNADGSKQLAGDSVIPVKSYTADGTGLSLTYYQTAWPVANWQIKMS